jgi:ATP-dependent Zn protease
VDDEVREVVMRGYETARQLIGKHRRSVHAMAEELLKVESLDSEGIKAIIAATAA